MFQVLNRSRYSVHFGSPGGEFTAIASPGETVQVPADVWEALKDRPLYKALVEAGHLTPRKVKSEAGAPVQLPPEENTAPIELDGFVKEFLDMHHTQAKSLIEDLTDADEIEKLLAVETRASVRDALVVQLKALG